MFTVTLDLDLALAGRIATIVATVLVFRFDLTYTQFVSTLHLGRPVDISFGGWLVAHRWASHSSSPTVLDQLRRVRSFDDTF